MIGFFEIGSHELFAQAGFEPQSSRFLPSEWVGLLHEPLVPGLLF
jgi:hypothetical protein